jgi:hypothetical protein
MAGHGALGARRNVVCFRLSLTVDVVMVMMLRPVSVLVGMVYVEIRPLRRAVHWRWVGIER